MKNINFLLTVKYIIKYTLIISFCLLQKQDNERSSESKACILKMSGSVLSKLFLMEDVEQYIKFNDLPDNHKKSYNFHFSARDVFRNLTSLFTLNGMWTNLLHTRVSVEFSKWSGHVVTVPSSWWSRICLLGNLTSPWSSSHWVSNVRLIKSKQMT